MTTYLYIIKFWNEGELETLEEGPFPTEQDARTFAQSELDPAFEWAVFKLPVLQRGDYVRSYDFEGRTDCYVEGTVERVIKAGQQIKFDHPATAPHDMLQVLISRTVWADKPSPMGDVRRIYPPQNGVQKLTGGFTCDVLKLGEVSPEPTGDKLTALDKAEREWDANPTIRNFGR